MTYTFYKILHYWGLFTTFASLGVLAYVKIFNHPPQKKEKKMLMMTHGMGLTALLFGGFGMLAKINSGNPLPNWVIGKLIIWLFLGVSVLLLKRLSSKLAIKIWWLLPPLGALAGYFAIAKF